MINKEQALELKRLIAESQDCYGELLLEGENGTSFTEYERIEREYEAADTELKIFIDTLIAE